MIHKESVTMTNMHTPLHHITLPETVADAGIVMSEDKLVGHLNLRGNPADQAFTETVAKVLGVALPMEPHTGAEVGATRIYWLSPNEWLLLVAPDTQEQVELDLRAALKGQHMAITDISSGQTLVNLAGTAVDELMLKSTVYDCHISNFPVGKVVQTTFAKTGATIYKCADGSFDLVIRRSFADYFYLWLKDASDEYGLAVI
jgi:sarcosine oxidase subunit gamma